MPDRLQAEFHLSIVVPMYNEGSCIRLFYSKLQPVLKSLDCSFEVVFVDDGSVDDTVPAVHALMTHYDDIRLIRLTRNFGKERALAAGIDHARGDAVIPIDADLQDPPEVILELVRHWRLGYDMVVASRTNRPGDSHFKRHSANWFYRIMNYLSEVTLPRNAGDFRLLDRKVVDALKSLPESTRFHKGLFAWLGFNTHVIEFERPVRISGETKWSFWSLWNYALDGIFSFSTVPLKLWAYVGVATALAGFTYALFVIVRTLALGIDVPGYASLLVLLLVLNGLCMIGIGVVGEYVGRIFTEVKHRPLYFVDSIEESSDTIMVREQPHSAKR